MDRIKERVIEELLYSLDECFEGEGQDGGIFLEPEDPGLFSILNALDAREASMLVSGMSIVSHVHHLLVALYVFIKRVNGDKDFLQVDWNTSWRERSVNEAEWARMKKELADLREEAVSAARTCKAGYDKHIRLVMGLLTHTVFHLGIIRVKFDMAKGRNS